MIDPTFKKANILIVDDQEANIDVLEGLLLMQGYTNVVSVTDSREVINILKSFQADLLLLDLTMPYLSGFDIMQQLKTLNTSETYLPILVLTADAAPETKQNALSGGATDFLTKPFDLIEVGLRIRNLLFTSFLQQQLLQQNQILEIKVKERTQELEKTNIELMRAKDKAEASDRLKTSFINNISHEIRTPLNGILGFGQIIAERNLSPEDKTRYLNLLNKSSARLVATVTNFLDASLLSSRSIDIRKKTITLENWLQALISEYREVCHSKNIIINVHSSDTGKEIQLHTDVNLLKKILNHLIDNAIKFTSQGSITVGFQVKDRFVHLFVRDTGTGISEENKKNIFDSFMQEDLSNTRGFEGSGLGLTIAKGMVELLGGKIWLDTEKGNGTTFYFSVPEGSR